MNTNIVTSIHKRKEKLQRFYVDSKYPFVIALMLQRVTSKLYRGSRIFKVGLSIIMLLYPSKVAIALASPPKFNETYIILIPKVKSPKKIT